MDKIYSLIWVIEDNIKLHGVGMVNNEQMVLAWAGIDINYIIIN